MSGADFIAGWTAGGFSLIISHPLDTVKARVQTSNTYKGFLDCAVKSVKTEKVRGLYKGMFVPFCCTGGINAVLFGGYGVGLKLLTNGEDIDPRAELPMTHIIFASMCGSLAQMMPAIPIDLVKTRLQVQTELATAGGSLYKGPIDVVRKTVKTDGVTGMFRGGSALFIRDKIGYVLYIPVYEFALRYFRSLKFNEYLAQMVSGSVAGLTSYISVTPFELIKNRMQVEKEKKLTLSDACRQIYQESGMKGFFRGGVGFSMIGVLSNAFLFIIYEKTYATVNGYI